MDSMMFQEQALYEQHLHLNFISASQHFLIVELSS